MDLARDDRFDIDASPRGCVAAPASTAVTGEIVCDLLALPNAPQGPLARALQESNRRFESLLSCLSGTFYRCELTPPWRMEFVTEGIEAITGHAPAFFARHAFGALILPEDLPALERTVALAVERREHFSACYRIRHSSGSVRWVSERGAAVCDATGRPQFLEGFIADVTEAKQLEIEAEQARAQAEEANARMRGILEFTLEGIVAFDADWRFRFCNKTAIREFGGKRAIGKLIGEVHPGYRQAGSWPAMKRAMETREPVREERRLADRWFELYIVPDDSGIVCFFRDISDRKQLEDTLVSQAEKLRNTLDSLPVMVMTTHPDGEGDYFNKAWNDFVGDAGGSGQGYSTLGEQWIHPDDLERAYCEWSGSLASGDPFEVETRLRHRSGEYRSMIVRSWPQRGKDGKIVKWCSAAIDIHDRILIERSLIESRNLQISLLDASSDCIQVTDPQGNLLFVNSAGVKAASDPTRRPVVGGRWIDIWAESSRLAAARAFRRAQRGKVARMLDKSVTAKGVIWWDIIVSPIRDIHGAIGNVLCIARDVTEQRATSERLRIASEHDVLTGLPNRRAFEKHLKTLIGSRGEGASLGLMLLDLDHFKHVNDTLGHLAGDHLLKAVARRLRASVGDAGFVARLGGDEFAILLHDIGAEQDLVDAAMNVLARIEVPVTFAGKLINGGLSIGGALYPRDADDAQSLLQHADTALYDLKASGRGGIQMFDCRMMEAAERTANQLTLARSAIRDDAIEPYYQPKVRLDTGEISGLEALLRWWSPGNGIQPPSSVAEAFNDYELSTRIGALMQTRIFADMARWLECGLALPPVSVNAAPAEFLRDDYAERLLDRLGEFRIPAALIEVEITEHAFLERRSEHVVRALELLKQAGVRIALDDFGTGHSSLSHLRDFPVDVLKIDRSFVSRMLSKPRMLAIVQAITKLGPSLALDIVAEGVETPDQLHALRDAGCEFGQGYLFGKAMQASEIERRLATANWPFKIKPVHVPRLIAGRAGPGLR